MTDCKRLMAVAVTIAFLITGIACISTVMDDDSSADGSATNHKFYLDSALYFTDADKTIDSVNMINTKAGATVCGYADNCLTFTDNVEIYGYSSEDDGLFILGSTVEKISVSENITAKIFFTNGLEGSSAISKENGDLTLSGPGTLLIDSCKNGIVSNSNVHFEGNVKIYSNVNGVACSSVYFDEGSKVYISADTNGIYVLGKEMVFKKCNLSIYAEKYGILDPYASKISLESCYLIVISKTAAFSKCPSTRYTSFCSIYGSDMTTSTDDMNKIEVGDIAKYKCVTTTSQGSLSDIPLDLILIIVPIVITIVIVIAVIVILKKKNRYGTVAKKGNTYDAPAYIPQNHDDVQKSDKHTYGSKIQDQNTDEPRRTSSDDGHVEVITQSLVAGESFMLMVDGRVVGYIGPQKAFIDVTPGMRNIAVITNDTDRKTIYQTNQIIRNGMNITVRKRIGGYKVEIR